MSSKKSGQQNPHNDWGRSEAGSAGNAQSGVPSNIGGNPGSQHNDWGHSPVPTGGNRRSGEDLPRQGVMPGEEMGHLPDRAKPG
jgi:hypothetical protein